MKFEGYVIVSDMDGTLLNSKGKLSDENKEAIKCFTDNGGVFTIATGRMLASAGRFVQKLNVGLPVVLYNGTKVYDYKENKVIYETYLENERMSIIKNIKSDYPNLGIEIYCEEKVYIYSSCDITSRFSKLGYDVIYDIKDDIWDKQWTKVLIIGDEEELNLLEEQFVYKYDNGTVIRSGERFFEIVPNNTSKGQALKVLLESYNIDFKKVITVGDNMNDVEMLQLTPHGFVVSNGSERLLSQINNKTVSNDEHVITDIIKWLEKSIINS